ncbi:hypothetical protein KJ673_00215, partial [Patescibacteria group bacterium]|nr:hypothetical protein [Patescibacteria group bacterium]
NRAGQQIETLRQKLDSLPETQGETPDHIFNIFYTKEQERWESADVDWDVIDRYFTIEELSKMSIEDYVKLLRRFPQEMVTHVSRHGIRDHYSQLVGHDTGFDQFSDGFDKLLEQHMILSPFGIKLEEDTKKEFVAGELGLYDGMSRVQAIARLEKKLDESGWASFNDFSAVHVAVEQVADSIYGSERGNEVFVAFPSALIASKFEFGGHHSDLSKANSDVTRNDAWIWAKDTEGIPIDVGIVFLPSDARVNLETGSKYSVDEEKRPRFHQEYIDAIIDIIEDENISKAIIDTREAIFNLPQKYSWNSDIGYGLEYEKEKKDLIDRLREQILGKNSDQRLADAITGNIQKITEAIEHNGHKGWEDYAESIIKDVLRQNDLYYVEADNVVDSKTFWESYFAKYPERKPSKIVYYEGGDPTLAFKKWREENGIIKKASDLGIKYDDRERVGPGGSKTADRFRSIAMEIIEESGQ